MKKNRFAGIVCTCNMVTRERIEKAILRGCHRVDRISAATTAGAGQCGGTCRPEIQRILDAYLATGAFPQPKR